MLHPGSGLAKKAPRWVLAAELVETQRLYARVAARVEPEWIEAVAGDRVTREHFEPHWDEGRGEVVASERVQLYGLTLVPRRRVSFGAIDPATAREVFIREALVPGALATKGAFLAHNQRQVAEVAELEHKARRQDVLVDDETIAAFYAARLPDAVCTLAGFERWREEAERAGSARPLPHPRRADAPRRGARDRGALSGVDRDGRHPAAGEVPLRARASARRPDRDRAAGDAQPARRRPSHLAGARDGARQGHPLSEVAAQGLAQPAGADPRQRDRVPRGGARAAARRCPRRFAAGSASGCATRRRRRSGTMRRRRRISPSTFASSTRPGASWDATAIRRCCGRSSAKPRR